VERIEERRGRTIGDRALAFVGGAMVIVALLLLLFGGERDTGEALVAPPPAIDIGGPSPGDLIESPLEIRFRTGAPIGALRGGWGVGEFHLHAELGGMEIMPGPSDLRRLPDGSYLWTIGRLAAGEHTFRLFWSDAAHRPLDASATPAVTVRVR